MLGAVIGVLLAGCGGGEPVSTSQDSAPPPSEGTTPPPSQGTTPPPAQGTTPPPSPPPTTSSVTLSWVAPTQNSNGSVLTNLSGYTIYYGTDEASLSSHISLTNPGLAMYVVDGLEVGQTYYFAIAADASTGIESTPSAIVSTIVH